MQIDYANNASDGLGTLLQDNYHYHVYSECLTPCTGESQIYGVALDGFPIMGPGINPETNMPWCQSDMDHCGGREDENGNYAYYITPDFPYSFQCYAGTPVENVNAGECGFYGANCAWEARPNARKRRSLDNPTAEWFAKAMDLYAERGEHGAYFQGRFGEIGRTRRDADGALAARA